MYRFPRSRGRNSNVGCGLPRHQCERGLEILNLGLAVFRWRFGPLREAFSVDVLHKKRPQWREPRGGPLNLNNLCRDNNLNIHTEMQPRLMCMEQTYHPNHYLEEVIQNVTLASNI